MTNLNLLIPLSIFTDVLTVSGIAVAIIIFGLLILFVKAYKKVPQGKALVKTGVGGTKVSFNGMMVLPVLHKLEIMDISLKSVEVSRLGKDGLICKDNMRADIKVVFFVRINQTVEAVKNVAQSIGCARASHQETLVQLFDAKFSEALKTVGKQFDFVELYNSRDSFKKEILNIIGTDLNGYELDDAAIDYLEQTPLEFLKDDNILDSEGIKKIAELTAVQHMAANKIRREEEKTLTQQNVEAKEAILELNKQLAEKEATQQREIANIQARETAETNKVAQEERLRAESARIQTEEEIAIAEENKSRQVIVAAKSKERTDAVETERVLKDKELEVTERERVVTLAQIDKEKAVEEERKNIQDVIRERVIVEKAVVEEEEKIKDTKAFADADRQKTVAVTLAEKNAQEALITKVQAASAEKQSAEIQAEQKLIEAEADKQSAEKHAEAKKMMAKAQAAEEAALGMSEAQVMEAKAHAREQEGIVEANIIEKKAIAEANGIAVKAEADEKAGLVDANVMEKQALAEAKGIQAKGSAEAQKIEEKAEAMKKLDGVGKEHEEFKLQLEKDTQIQLAQINIEKDIAAAQAMVLAEALKSANIDIVGGESTFFDKIVGAITQSKRVDALVEHSDVIRDAKDALLKGLDGNGGDLIEKVRGTISKLGLTSADIKNLSIAALIMKISAKTEDSSLKSTLTNLLNTAWEAGVANKPATLLGLTGKEK